MVQYLGLDYLRNALDKKRKFLDKALLAVPNHLEHIDEYVHHGQLKNLKYRQPWARAMCDEKFLENECKMCVNEYLDIKLEETQCIVPLESFSVEEHGYFDLYEYVLSSNPGSQELCVDLDFIIKSDKIETLHHTDHKELFEKEDITYWSASPDCKNYYLEELCKSDYLRNTLQQMPRSHVLLSRLYTKQIEDPFIVTDDEDFKWHILKDLEEFSLESEFVKDTDTGFLKYEEHVDKVNITISDGTLEQCLSPCVMQKIEENLSESYTKETLVSQKHDDLMYQDNDHNLEKLAVRLKNKIGEKYRENLESAMFLPAEIYKASFLEINVLGEDEDDLFVTKSLLDSPIKDVVLMSDEGISAKSGLQLKPFLIPSETLRLLTPQKKEKLQKKFRDREKIFEDILELQLPEPETDQSYDIIMSGCEARQKLALTKEEELGKLELTLDWDYLSFTSNKMAQHKDIESFDGSLSPLVSTNFSKEEFQKYSDIDLYGWQDARLNSNLQKPFVREVINADEQRTGEKKSLKRSNDIECSQKKQPAQKKEKFDLNFDPLDSFLIMRSNNHIFTMSQKDPSPQQQERKKSKDEHSISKLVKPDRKKSKCKMFDVELSDEFKEVIGVIEKTAGYFITTLKEAGNLLSTHEFGNLTPDITRFLLKQREKYLQDNNQDGIDDTCYRAIIAVHALCGASEILTNCCLESAIAHLTAMQEKYQKFLRETLERIRQELFKIKCNLHKDRILHPKVFTLCQKIEAKIKKSLYASPDSEQKVLIIVKRDLQSLMECLKDAVCNGGIIRAKIQTNFEHESIIKSLDDYNCLIMLATDIKDDFPWAQFSFVVEYERDDSEKISSLCQRLKIRYFTIVVKDKSVSDNASTTNLNEKKSCYSQITVIGSVKLTTQPDLLHILETRYNLLILERDFSLVNAPVKQMFADLIIDEKTCIVLHPISDLSEEYQLEPFVSKLICLSVKYSVCWIIFYHNGTNCYQYSNCAVSNISKLHATVANYLSKTKDFSVKILATSSNLETATIIRNICEISIKLSHVWKLKDWENRQWISEEMHQSEKILLTIPCMNSFCAQLMLHSASLSTLLGLSYEELARRFPWIPTKVLKIFFQLVNSNTGLGLGHCQSFDSIDTSKSSDTSVYDAESTQCYMNTKPSLSPNVSGGNNAFMEKTTYDLQLTKDEKSNRSKMTSEVLHTDDFIERNGKNVLFDKNCNSNLENQDYERYKDENFYRMNISQDSTCSDRFSLSSSQLIKPNEYVKAEIEGRQLKQGQNQHIISKYLNVDQSYLNSDLKQSPFLCQKSQTQRVPISFVTPQESPREVTQNENFQTNGQHFMFVNAPQPVFNDDHTLGKRISKPIRNTYLQTNTLPSQYSVNLDGEHSQFNDNQIINADPSFRSLHSRNIPTFMDNINRTNVLQTENSQLGSDVLWNNTTSVGLNFHHNFSNLPLQSQYFKDSTNKMSKPVLDYQMQQNCHELKECVYNNGVESFHENTTCHNNLPNRLSQTKAYPAQYSFSLDEEHAQNPLTTNGDERRNLQGNSSLHHENEPSPSQYQHDRSRIYRNSYPSERFYCQQSRNFVDDLSQTTRNILKHACQNKYFRPPVHRISIGLAQPQPRKNTDTESKQREETAQVNVSADSRTNITIPARIQTQNSQLDKNKFQRTGDQNLICEEMMFGKSEENDRAIYNNGKLAIAQQDSVCGYGQSLWSSYSSPPMDFDSETCLTSCNPNVMDIQNNTDKTLKHSSSSTGHMENNGFTNRMVFNTNHSTPRKKRKLTYHKTPGSRGGQTKLVFQ